MRWEGGLNYELASDVTLFLIHFGAMGGRVLEQLHAEHPLGFLIHFGAMGGIVHSGDVVCSVWFLIHFGAMGGQIIAAKTGETNGFLIHFGAMGGGATTTTKLST